MNPSDRWPEYARLQKLADRQKLDAKAWAAEEQADEFLKALAKNTLKPAGESCEAWLKNLATNRAKKHRRRAAKLHVYQHLRPVSAWSEAHAAVVQNECVECIRANTSAQEWSALWALALGESYRTVAAAEGSSVSALKARVSRGRRRLLVACG